MSDATEQFPIFLTTKQTAGILNISRRTLNTLIAAGRGPRVHKIGHRRRIKKTDLMQWVDKQRG